MALSEKYVYRILLNETDSDFSDYRGIVVWSMELMDRDDLLTSYN